MKKLADRSKASYSTGNYWLTIFPEGTRSRPDKIKVYIYL
jgi:1-acyl-sn-glycerol-3-phosphate acyltransferase